MELFKIIRSLFRAGGAISGTPSVSTFLRGDGAWSAAGTVLLASYQTTTATGSGFQNLLTVTIPAGTLGTNRVLRFDVNVRRTTGAAACTMRATYGGTSFGSVAVGTAAAAAFGFRGKVWGTGAVGTQRGECHAYQNNSSSAAAGVGGTSAIDSSAAQTFTVDVDLTTDGDVFTCDCSLVEIL